MSDVTITVNCPVEDDDGIRTCEAEIEVQCEGVPGENYGADADGNRGMWIPPHIEPGSPPDKCPECGTVYDKEQLKVLEEAIEQACRDYTIDPPEYDYYED